MAIVLVRHGETALNAARVLQPEDTPLGEVGLRQARALAARIAALAPAAILASDLPRAWQTAAAIAAATGLEPRPSPLLRERDFGVLRGRAYDTLGFDPLAMRDAPQGGESQAAFLARVAQAFDAMVALHARAGGAVAVVTHGLVIQALLARHASPAPGGAPVQRLANASLSIVGAQPPHAIALVGCTRHLEPATAGAMENLHGG